jgi:DNA-binding GntR family transcriptional regulator
MIDTTPLNEQIVRQLKSDIIAGRLSPGQRLSIDDLAQRWKVSTTPVRDAIRSLESSGFVVVSPRKSIVIATLDLKAFKDVFDLRIALECLAIELAIPKIPEHEIDECLFGSRQALIDYEKTGQLEYLGKVDDDVHNLVLKYCDNQKLVAMMDDLHDLIVWTRGIVIQQPKSFDEAAREHIQIFENMKKRDQQGAVAAMRSHLLNSYERTRLYWDENNRHNA